MTNANEKLRLQWNDFKDNVSSAFGDLKQDKEFTDVTLVFEDGQQVEAHKVVLVASSPFFLNILKKSKHPHPLIYMRGVRPENMLALVDLIFHGEADVFQENLDSFLVLASELHLKGLRENKTETEEEVSQEQPPKQRFQQRSHNSRSTLKKHPPNKNVSLDDGPSEAWESEKALAPVDNKTNSTDVTSLDQQVKSMMEHSTNAMVIPTATEKQKYARCVERREIARL